MVGRADFYQLKSSDPASRYPLLCRLLEKSVASGQHVYIQCEDEAESLHLDEYIWAFKPDSFIPHERIGEGNQAKVIIGYAYTEMSRLPKHSDICINLSKTLAPKNFERIIELVTQDPAMLASARSHYSQYSQMGRTMQYHKL